MVVKQNSNTIVHGSYLLRFISAEEVRTASCLAKSCIMANLHECCLTTRWDTAKDIETRSTSTTDSNGQFRCVNGQWPNNLLTKSSLVLFVCVDYVSSLNISLSGQALI